MDINFDNYRARKAFTDIQEDTIYNGLINQQEQQPEPNIAASASLSVAPSDAISHRR